MATVASTLFKFGNPSLKNAYLIPLSLFGLTNILFIRATKAPSYSSPCFKKENDLQTNSSHTLVAINSEMADTNPYPPLDRISSNKLTNNEAAINQKIIIKALKAPMSSMSPYIPENT